MRWLYFLTKLGRGACLAGDMEPGKTPFKLLSLLLALKRRRRYPPGTDKAGCPRVCPAGYAPPLGRHPPPSEVR